MEDRVVLYVFVLLMLLAVGVYVKVRVLPLLRIAGVLIKLIWRIRANLRRDFDPWTRQGRWRLLGSVLTVVAAIVAIALVAVMRSESSQNSKIITLILSIPLCWVTAHLAVLCFWRAKRLEVSPAVKPSSKDTRTPVIYLRSFQDDSKVYGRMEMTGLKFSTEEEIIAELVIKIGPLVAIGQPGDALPYPGAARLYMEMGDWQDGVRTLLLQSKLVIVRAGDTPGLRWEIKECISIVRPERLIFLFPLSRRKYERFCEECEKYFPCRLPEYTGRWIPNISIRAVLFFDSTWTPTLVPLRQKGLAYWWRSFVKSQFISADDLTESSEMRRALENTLQPLLRRELD